MDSKKSQNKCSVPFSLPSRGDRENQYISMAMQSVHRHGSGPFTKRATAEIQAITNVDKVLLTHSCTGALELAMLLLDIGQGDEVILPSYTFPSTANAVVLRGAVPVFADIDPLTQCIDPGSVRQLITPRTRAIMPVHYAGMACDMPSLCEIAKKHTIHIVEDAAQAIGSTLHGKALGSFGELGTLSFHDSKNISCGEGGALLVNDEALIERAEILWEKGTNRSQFMRGEIDKYSWVDLGSSFLPSDVSAAFLLGQLERVNDINRARCDIWYRYYHSFAALEADGICVRPVVPKGCQHNGHIFYLILANGGVRDGLLDHLRTQNISATFHFVPLHASPAGIRFGSTPNPVPNSERAGSCLVRLPIFPDMTLEQQEYVIQATSEYLLAAGNSQLDAVISKVG